MIILLNLIVSVKALSRYSLLFLDDCILSNSFTNSIYYQILEWLIFLLAALLFLACTASARAVRTNADNLTAAVFAAPVINGKQQRNYRKTFFG